MPPRPRKKSVAQRPAPNEQPPTMPLHDPKNFDRYKFFFDRRVFPPYILSLDVAEQFGIRDEVEEMVSLPEWMYLLMDFEEETYKAVLVEVMTTMKVARFDGITCSPCMQFYVGHTMFRFSPDEFSDLMGFGPVQQLTEEETYNRVADVPNTQQFWEEITDVCGRFDSTSSVNHVDLFCLYSMVKHVRLQMRVVIWNLFKNQYQPRGAALYLGPYLTRILRATQRIVLIEPKASGMQPLTAEAVERMRDKIGAKRDRIADATDERMEEEAYNAHPDSAGPVHAGAGKGSSFSDFQQQVLAQLAAMNMKVDQIYKRMDDMEAANAQSCDEARAYYEWMQGHYPPPGSPQFPPFDPSFMG
nr:hypothetical protein Itr_chr10CG13300 [Ipomoea trifida]